MHIAGLPKLAHGGVDKGYAGASALPGAEQRIIITPVEPVEFGLQIAPFQLRVEIEQRMRELAPTKLGAEIVDIGLGKVVSRARRVPDLVDRYLAPVDVRRQSRDMRCRRQVTAILISGKPVVEEGRQARRGGGLAYIPVRGQHLAPAFGRQQAEFGNVASRRIGHQADVRHRKRKPRRRRSKAPAAIEGREDLERGTIALFDLPGFPEQRPIVAFGLDSRFSEFDLQLGVTLDAPGLVTAVPEHRACACFASQRWDQFSRIAGRHIQYAAKSVLQGLKRVMQPPTARRSDAVGTGAGIVEDEHRKNVAPRGCRGQCGIVGKSKVLAKPADGERARHRLPFRRA